MDGTYESVADALNAIYRARFGRTVYRMCRIPTDEVFAMGRRQRQHNSFLQRVADVVWKNHQLVVLVFGDAVGLIKEDDILEAREVLESIKKAYMPPRPPRRGLRAM
jgi:hypothetical protein